MTEARGRSALQPFVLFKVGQLELAMADALDFIVACPIGFSTEYLYYFFAMELLPPHTGPEIANTVGRRRNGRSIYTELARIASPCFDLEPELHLYLYALLLHACACACVRVRYMHIYV